MTSPFIIIYPGGIPAAFPADTSLDDVVACATGSAQHVNGPVEVARDEGYGRFPLGTAFPDGTYVPAS